jgi:hypothetical protein
LVAREKLLLERRLSAKAQGFILPKDQASEKGSASRVTISGGCRRLLGISPHQKAADENYLWQDVRTQSFHGLLQKVLHFRFSPKKQTFPEKQTLGQKDNRHSACPASAGSEVRNLS